MTGSHLGSPSRAPTGSRVSDADCSSYENVRRTVESKNENAHTTTTTTLVPNQRRRNRPAHGQGSHRPNAATKQVQQGTSPKSREGAGRRSRMSGSARGIGQGEPTSHTRGGAWQCHVRPLAAPPRQVHKRSRPANLSDIGHAPCMLHKARCQLSAFSFYLRFYNFRFYDFRHCRALAAMGPAPMLVLGGRSLRRPGEAPPQ